MEARIGDQTEFPFGSEVEFDEHAAMLNFGFDNVSGWIEAGGCRCCGAESVPTYAWLRPMGGGSIYFISGCCECGHMALYTAWLGNELERFAIAWAGSL